MRWRRINNSGTLVGLITLSGSDDVLNNLSSNTWVAVGTNNFAAGTDTVNNVGRTVTALQGDVAEYTAFEGLEAFNNGDVTRTQDGLLTMIDETPGQTAFNGPRDVTYISGVLNGVGNSTIGLDAFIGGPGSTSDMVLLGGLDASGNPVSGSVASGTTRLLIHDLNAGAGSFNPFGLTLVQATDPAATLSPNSFVLSPGSTGYDARFGGVLNKGLFFYDLAVVNNAVVLVGAPDTEVFQVPALVTGAQTIWHDTAGQWLDHQADLRAQVRAAPVNGQSGNAAPAVWAKAVGSWATRNATATHTIALNAYSHDTGYSQDTYGILAGVDFGKEGVGAPDATLMFGLMGGYLSSNQSFDQMTASASYSGGTVGAYASYLKSNWFVDALFKADFLSMDYEAPTLLSSGYLGSSANVRNLGFMLDAGYRYDWGKSIFIEPLVTLSYVNTHIGNLTLTPGALADFGNNDSLRAGLGGRLGATAYEAATLRIETSLTGRLWYEFLADNSATLLNPGLPFEAYDDFDGLFGEVGLGLNVVSKDSGWSGFVDGNVKFGEGYTAGTAKGGIRLRW